MMAATFTAAAAVLAAATVTIAVIRHRILVVRVSGPSMAPTLRSGDRLVVRRSGLVPHAGDIVVLPEPGPCRPGSPTNAPLIVKRVAATAGDAWERAPHGVVPSGHVVLLGDNPAASRDSRHFGPVNIDRLVGVAVRRLGGSLYVGGTTWAGRPSR